MPPTPNRAPLPGPRGARRRLRLRGRDAERGQSLVEFSLILVPLFLLLLGVVQFGFIFNTYVTLSTAAREAAREGSIYVYTTDVARGANDTKRNDLVKSTLLVTMNGLATTSPQFSTGTGWTSTSSGTTTTFTDGDLVIVYDLPAGVTDSDARVGYLMTVKATYHQDLVIPMIGALLPRDSNGRLGLGGEVTMVIN